MLARAHEAAGRPDSAVAYDERIPAHPGQYREWWNAIYLADVLEPLAALHEARGDHPEAVATWNRLVELWGRADPGLQPHMERALARALALRRDDASMWPSALRRRGSQLASPPACIPARRGEDDARRPRRCRSSRFSSRRHHAASRGTAGGVECYPSPSRYLRASSAAGSP